jgi:hypothetical protein
MLLISHSLVILLNLLPVQDSRSNESGCGLIQVDIGLSPFTSIYQIQAYFHILVSSQKSMLFHMVDTWYKHTYMLTARLNDKSI